MCGVTGIFDIRGRGDVDRSLLRRMTDILAHRGPDGDGFHYAPGLGLGHRRLAIVDLVTGDQPLFNEDGTICVVYNGEIYNDQDLRRSPELAGVAWHGHSDTETIVESVARRGLAVTLDEVRSHEKEAKRLLAEGEKRAR